MKASSTAATAPVLELDGLSWRFASAADAETLEALAGVGSNRLLFSLPGDAGAFAQALQARALRFAMVCSQDGKPFGAAALTVRSTRDQNAMLVCFFLDALAARTALAAYVRHIFWMQPVHRLYTLFPLLDGADAYRRLLTSVGFVEEGVVARHALVGGVPVDVVVLGLIRREFESWCRENESRLSL